MRHLAEELETFSLGDSKREGDDEDAMGIAATPLEVSSSSADEYSSCASNTILGGFLLKAFFSKKVSCGCPLTCPSEQAFLHDVLDSQTDNQPQSEIYLGNCSKNESFGHPPSFHLPC